MFRKILGIAAFLAIYGFTTPASAKTVTEVHPITPKSSATEVHEIFLKSGEYLEAPALGSDGKLRLIRIIAPPCSPAPETPTPTTPAPAKSTTVTVTP